MRWPWQGPKPLGERGEDLAAKYLRRAGFTILERNAHLGRFEIDIIAQTGDTIAFVEVKTRRDTTIAQPEDNVGHTKRRHIRHAAHRYIQEHDNPDMYYRFDIASILIPPDGEPEITYFPDAFPDE
jgi:putative endonuclease